MWPYMSRIERPEPLSQIEKQILNLLVLLAYAEDSDDTLQIVIDAAREWIPDAEKRCSDSDLKNFFNVHVPVLEEVAVENAMDVDDTQGEF